MRLCIIVFPVFFLEAVSLLGTSGGQNSLFTSPAHKVGLKHNEIFKKQKNFYCFLFAFLFLAFRSNSVLRNIH